MSVLLSSLVGVAVATSAGGGPASLDLSGVEESVCVYAHEVSVETSAQSARYYALRLT